MTDLVAPREWFDFNANPPEKTCYAKKLAEGWLCCSRCNEDLSEDDRYCPNCGAKVVGE